MTMQPDQRERLLGAKLAGLVRSQSGSTPDVSEPVVKGALTVWKDGPRAYGLVERGDPGPLASAVLWAHRAECSQLTLFVDAGAATAARFASYFVNGAEEISVLQVDGPSAEVVVPDRIPQPVADPDVAGELLEALRDQNLEIVVEHGVVRGELLGLEVARLVRWPASHGGDGELHLEPGVGRFDRDAVAAVNADLAPAEALSRTVELVRRHRYPGAPAHPLSLLCRERWLRTTIIGDPERVGARKLVAVAMTTEAEGLRDPHPAAAYGERPDGRPLLVVCSTGIDMAAVPLAADLRDAIDPSADLVVAVPRRDRHSATVELADMLRGRVEVVATEVDWG